MLVGKVLKFANSAFYGFPRRIDSLKEAIIILGLDTLKSIVLAVSTVDILTRDAEGYGLASGELYTHALCCAMFARKLSKKINKKNRERYFIAGLLHDVGKLLLEPYTRKHYNEIRNCVQNGDLTLAEAERRVLEFDHAFVGARLAEKWNLPEALVAMIEFHHDPAAAPEEYRTDAALVFAANILSFRLKKGMGKPLQYNFDDIAEINRFFPITEGEIAIFQQEVRQALNEIEGI